MEKATEIFKKHWVKKTGKQLDETTKNHMKYAIEAINEALHKALVMRSCPFCGVKPKMMQGWTAPAGVGTAWGCTITCSSKRCIVHPQISAYTIRYNGAKKLKLQVIDAWNKRA